jgi:uncharacterized membrane protein
MGRPRKLYDDTLVSIKAQGTTKLQANSDRRAVIQLLVDTGGRMTMGEINRHFGFDISTVVRGLMRSGWLEVIK